MSDHEENASDTRYNAPMPELDDHRHQAASAQRQERPRRGTFDSLYGSRHIEHEQNTPAIRVRDFEEAVIDEESGQISPTARRSRRPTVDSSDGRSISPPNSVKAFAEARRREREMSFSESRPEQEDGLSRAMSISSKRSFRSRPHTIDVDDDAVSVATTAEEDVCFPLKENQRKDKLFIDFDYLDEFILEQVAREEARKHSVSQSFEDLRTHTANSRPTQMATLDGDILEFPSEDSMTREKTAEPKPEKVPQQQAPVDSNRFSFFSSAWESTIHAPEMGDLVLPGEDIRGLFELPEDEEDGVWWLNVNTATKEEIQAICKAFGIHPLTIEDIITQEAREKIELFPSYYFACFRSFHIVQEPDGIEYEPFNIYVIVFREGTLSFSFAPNSHATQVRKRITALKDYVSLSSDWICYALIDDIVDSFGPHIRQIELEADAIEDEVFVMREDDSSSFLRSIGRVRKNCMALLRLLGGKADVLRGFTKRCNENYKVTPRMDIGMYLGDIQDHVVTMATSLGHFEKILSRSHSNYLATLSINSISQGTETNQVLSKITFLASVLVPLNLVSGVFGMNVLVPFKDTENLGPFFGIIGFMTFLLVPSGAVNEDGD
ncbi:putative metal ion transporter C27B12.12c [Neonectria ditissima]|uniref:Putative metal ion transporter C27B12.12c n=1 Tax=Neonectria ditissima TaxID=78410 RepID=A0A0P7B720_9HYPO|nr:putative metal ion transporter C27B12.12c [Neonectria ditissima]